MKFCVLGNSQIAALKLGAEKLGPEHAAHAFEFFGGAMHHLEQLKPKSGRLVAAGDRLAGEMKLTSGGKSSIDPKDYDAFVVVGLYFGLYEVGEMLEDHRLDFRHGSKELISPLLMRRAARDLLERSLAIKTAEKVFAVTDKPVYLVPTPFPSEPLAAKSRRVWKIPELVAQLRALYEEESRAIAADHGLILIEQPDDTVTNSGFTLNTYSTKAARLHGGPDNEHAEIDFRHMNAHYGEKVMRALLADVEANPPKPRPQPERRLNLCVMGNSHLAAAKVGFDQADPAFTDKMTFFGLAAEGLGRLVVDDTNALVAPKDTLTEKLAMTSGGLNKITGDYDAYILVGLEFGILEIGNMFRDFRLWDAVRSPRPISLPLVRRAVRDWLETSLALEVADKVRAITDAPIVLIPTPYPASYASEHPREVWSDPHMTRIILDEYHACAAEVVKAHGLIFCPPPKDTRDGAFSKAEYSLGSVRLASDEEHRENDFRHMNGHYGERMLREALKLLAKTRSSAPAELMAVA